MLRRLFIFQLLSVLTLLLVAPSAVAQRQYYFTQLTEKSGLTDGRITCIFQDSKKYIWIGTDYGLNRYDGYSFLKIVHKPGDRNSLSGNKVSSIVEDKNGMLWIAAAFNGINCYDPMRKKFRHFRHDSASNNSIVYDDVKSLYVDSKNRLWIGYWGEGWSVLDQVTGKFQHFRSDGADSNYYGRNTDNTITAFAEQKDGNFWIVSEHGLHYFHPVKGVLSSHHCSTGSNYMLDNLFTCLYKQDDTTLLLGTWAGGIKKFNTASGKFASYYYSEKSTVHGVKNIVLGIAKRNSREYWIATADKGLGVFDEQKGSFEFFLHSADNPNSPIKDECRAVYTDHQGTLWAGYDHGISRCVQHSEHFRFFSLSPFFDKKTNVPLLTAAFYKDVTDGRVYTGGSDGRGLYIVNEKTGESEVVPLSMDGAKRTYNISSVLPYNEECLLILFNEGLCLFNKRTKLIRKLPLNDQYGKRLTGGDNLIRDKAGNFWYSNNCIYKVNVSLTSATKLDNSSTSPVRLPNNYILLLAIENDTLAWYASLNNGLLRLNLKSGRSERIRFNRYIDPSIRYTSLLPVGNGAYWASGFEAGVFYFKESSNGVFEYKHYSQDEGLASDIVYKTQLDKSNRLWAVTSKGPARLLPNGKFKTFTEEDGYVFSKRLHNFYKAGDGYFYCTAADGYVRFYPDSLQINMEPPILMLQSLKIFDREWNDSVDLNTIQEIELPYNENFISAEFAGLNYLNTERNRYAYKMEGVNKTWIDAGNRRYLFYSGLAPGKYVLRIKASNNYGVWNEQGITISIIIHPPFWKTWWFYLLISCIVSVVIYCVYRHRLSRVRKEEELKTAFNRLVSESEMKALRAQMNPHFIFNSLNAINRYIVVSDPATASSYLAKFAKLIRLILDSSANTSTTLDQEIELLRLYIEMENFRFSQQFTYDFAVSDDLDLESIYLPSMIIQPYIENAIWHGLLHKNDKGHLKIIFEKKENLLEVIVEDNGIGRQKSTILKSRNTLRQRSYGMKITQNRIEIASKLYGLNATVNIDDLADADGNAVGTRVILQIPIEHRLHKQVMETSS